MGGFRESGGDHDLGEGIFGFDREQFMPGLNDFGGEVGAIEFLQKLRIEDVTQFALRILLSELISCGKTGGWIFDRSGRLIRGKLFFGLSLRLTMSLRNR